MFLGIPIIYFTKKLSLIDEYNLTFHIEAAKRTNSVSSRNLVISACFDIKSMITYSKFHKCFSIRIFLVTSR